MVTDPCEVALTELNPDYEFKLNFASAAVTLNPGGYLDFFDHPDPATCALDSSCELKYSSSSSTFCDIPPPYESGYVSGTDQIIFNSTSSSN